MEEDKQDMKLQMKKRSVNRLFNCFDENRMSFRSHDIIVMACLD